MNQSYKKMKRFIKLLSVLTILAFAGVACEKGDTGATGPAGPAGADGENGIDGTDGTAGCIQCHTGDENMQIKDAQWVTSGHVNGGHMGGFYGSRDGCADCHSSQGFQGVVATGIWNEPAPVSPLPANCFTCHQIHETYSTEDWSFRVGDNVEILVNEYLADQGNANTCIQCHQSRLAEPVLDLASTTDVEITNKRFGPHHGPQGNMLIGAGNSGAYELDGSMSYANSVHASSASVNCVSCHMASQAGSGGDMALGEHSNNIGVGSWEDDTRTINANGCVSCHSTLIDNSAATDFVSTARDANLVLLENLRVALYDLGYLDDDDYVATGNVTVSSSNPLVTSPAHAAAIYNYKFLMEDQSTLIHNANYGKALIQNSLDALQ
jgi:nitrate reductase cytochrome c-type subunit